MSSEVSSKRTAWINGAGTGKTKLRVIQAVVFCVVIAAVWGLVVAIQVIYHVPQDLNGSEMPQIMGETSCTAELYNGQICREALLARQSCLDNPSADNSSGEVYIPAGGDQDALERLVSRLLIGLQSLPANSQCQQTVAVPFLCSFLFGLCDNNGQAHLPSSGECRVVTEDLCQSELQLAAMLIADLQLPQCETLPETSLVQDCSGSEQVPPNSNDTSSPTTTGGAMSNRTLVCNDGFYLGDGAVCRPECGEWEEFPHRSRVAVDVFVVLQALVYIIGTIVLVVLSVIRYKRMIKFPSIFIVYSCLPLGVFELLLLIGYLDRKKLFCSSRDLLESLENPTAFCSLQGALFYYLSLLQVFMWFFHIVVIFWGIQFPFSSRRLKRNGYTNYLHFIIVVLSFKLAIIPLVVGFRTGGYSMSRFPPTTCLAVSLDATFYSFILPITVIMALGVSLVVYMFCLLYSNRSQTPYQWKTETNLRDRVVTHSQKWTAEIKLFIIFCYFFVFLALTQTAFTVTLRNQPKFVAELTKYFVCEAIGISGNTCERSFERLASDIPIAIGYTLLGLYPIVSLIYVVNIEEGCCRRKRSNSTSASTHSSSTLGLKGTMVNGNSVISKANSNLSLEHNV